MKLYNVVDLEDIKAFFVKEIEVVPLRAWIRASACDV